MSAGFDVGKFLGLTAALAVGAGAGTGAYYGVRAASSSPSSDDTDEVEPEEPEEEGPKLDIPTGPKLDIPPVDEPSDPNALRLDVPDPWGAKVNGGDDGGDGGVTQEVF